MIYFLKGIVEDMGDDFLAVDVSGVGYMAFASARTLAATAVGEAFKFYIYSNHNEQHGTTLFAFRSVEERTLYETLISVNGAGPKAGLAILSALSETEIVNAIATGDAKMLARAKGVGPKLAERLVRELAGKLGSIPTAISDTVQKVKTGTPTEVMSALVNLGYVQSQAQKAVGAASEEIGTDASFDNLFKASLKELR